NVNQIEFDGLPGASSLKLVTGVPLDLEELLEALLNEIENGMGNLHSTSPEAVMEEYKSHLFRKNVPSTFQLEDKSFFTGMIENVTQLGRLVVRTETDEVREFDLKEVRLCF